MERQRELRLLSLFGAWMTLFAAGGFMLVSGPLSHPSVSERSAEMSCVFTNPAAIYLTPISVTAPPAWRRPIFYISADSLKMNIKYWSRVTWQELGCCEPSGQLDLFWPELFLAVSSSGLRHYESRAFPQSNSDFKCLSGQHFKTKQTRQSRTRWWMVFENTVRLPII